MHFRRVDIDRLMPPFIIHYNNITLCDKKCEYAAEAKETAASKNENTGIRVNIDGFI